MLKAFKEKHSPRTDIKNQGQKSKYDQLIIDRNNHFKVINKVDNKDKVKQKYRPSQNYCEVGSPGTDNIHGLLYC